MASTMFLHHRTIGIAVGIVTISQFLPKLQVLLVYAGFLAAILKIVIISMSRIRADCTIVFGTLDLENVGFAVGIVSISQFWQAYTYFRFVNRPRSVDSFTYEF
jgi:hypothetical protein